jgi:hypothetical protein
MIYTYRNRFSLLLSAFYILCLLGLSQEQSYASCRFFPRLTSAVPIALVIANSKYINGRIRQPINDAFAMKKVLEEIGFRVIFKKELNQRAMDKATIDFSDCLRTSKGVGLFYFSGYGMQLSDRNYLLPINISIEVEADVKYDAFRVEKMFDILKSAENDLNIIILDASRDNPYPKVGKESDKVGKESGLANVSFPGAFIAYPTETGKTISNQMSKNSLYISTLTTSLQMAVRNQTRIEDVFMQVSTQVEEKSRGRQIPIYKGSLKKNFCFGGCKTHIKKMTRKKKAKLIVYSNADGARVFINDRIYGYIQNGTFRKELPVGKYKVRVEKHSSVVKSIVLQKTQRIEINLESVQEEETGEIILPSVGF